MPCSEISGEGWVGVNFTIQTAAGNRRKEHVLVTKWNIHVRLLRRGIAAQTSRCKIETQDFIDHHISMLPPMLPAVWMSNFPISGCATPNKRSVRSVDRRS
jgi:hypothetical protein